MLNRSDNNGNVRSECEEDEATDNEDVESGPDWWRQIEYDKPCVLSV